MPDSCSTHRSFAVSRRTGEAPGVNDLIDHVNLHLLDVAVHQQLNPIRVRRCLHTIAILVLAISNTLSQDLSQACQGKCVRASCFDDLIRHIKLPL